MFHSRRTSNAEPRKNRWELLNAVVVGGLGDGQVVSLARREVLDAAFDVGLPRQFLRTTEREEAVHLRDPAGLQEVEGMNLPKKTDNVWGNAEKSTSFA